MSGLAARRRMSTKAHRAVASQTATTYAATTRTARPTVGLATTLPIASPMALKMVSTARLISLETAVDAGDTDGAAMEPAATSRRHGRSHLSADNRLAVAGIGRAKSCDSGSFEFSRRAAGRSRP